MARCLPSSPAADVFPMMSEQELRDLGKDIKKNGLKQKIVIWSEVQGSAPDDDLPPEKRQSYVLDGRNRLDAMELVGLRTVTREGYLAPAVSKEFVSARRISASMTLGGKGGVSDFEERPVQVPDPIAYVISANIKRRHLTKKQQADLIVKAVETDSAKAARSVKRTAIGQLQGSTKDPVKAKVLEVATKNDISPRTAERALADHRGARPRARFSKCPECSAQTPDLAKHLQLKHKGKRPTKDTPPTRTRKQAISSLREMAINIDAIVWGFDMEVLGELPILATYAEAQKWIDLLSEAHARMGAHVRTLKRCSASTSEIQPSYRGRGHSNSADREKYRPLQGSLATCTSQSPIFDARGSRGDALPAPLPAPGRMTCVIS
jgi:hypothetical protein